MKRILLSLLTCWLLVTTVKAQQDVGPLDIQLNKNVLQPGDSLLITVTYNDSAARKMNQSLATVQLMIENEEGVRTSLRWPLINGQASGALFLSDSLARGKYTLLAGLQERFFAVVGNIENEKNIGSVQAMLLTKSGEWVEQKVPVESNGSFAITNWLFEDNALLAFSRSRNNDQPLNIRISTQLDSSYKPIAVAASAFYIGNPPSAVRQSLEQSIEVSESAFADRGTLLPAVIVRSTSKSRAQQFNEEYVTALFQSGNERLISILDDPSAFSYSSLFSYLQGRIAGLQIRPVGFNGGMARWRGSPVTFFLDEMRVSPQQIANMPMADIAIVKAFPPPFFGTPGGGGAIAVYTRRGGEAGFLPPNRQVFRVKGYTPSSTVLEMNRFGM